MLESVSWNNKNGIVLFGYEPINNLQEDIAEEISKQYISIYDFIFPIDKDNSLNLLEFPSFSIYFNIEDEKYYIKDFNIGVLMKIKIFKIENNTLIILELIILFYVQKMKILLLKYLIILFQKIVMMKKKNVE